MAAVAAQPVFRLLGANGLGVSCYGPMRVYSGPTSAQTVAWSRAASRRTGRT
jgi:hypothetical protein